MDLPQIFTHSMTRKMANVRLELSKGFDGISFQILSKEPDGRVIGETTITNLADLKEFNKKASIEGGLPKFKGKEIE